MATSDASGGVGGGNGHVLKPFQVWEDKDGDALPLPAHVSASVVQMWRDRV
jgi:hypothetical protein